MSKKRLDTNTVYQLTILLLSIILSFLGFKQFKLNSIHPDQAYQVVSIIDGDTFVIENYSQKIRLSGVDAPELKYPYGPESKAFLESLIAGKQVYIKDITADYYGRIVGYVYLGDQLINKTMIRQGYVDHDSRADKTIYGLDEAEALAKEEQLGIFGPDYTQTENLDNPDCSIKGNNNHGKKTYLFNGCTSFNITIIEKHLGDQWFCTEAEARKAGFTKSKNCFNKLYEKN